MFASNQTFLRLLVPLAFSNYIRSTATFLILPSYPVREKGGYDGGNFFSMNTN